MSEAKLRLSVEGVEGVVGGLHRVEGGLDAAGASAQRSGARLRENNTDLARIGKSSRETAFALRGLPAQFTDIFVSLQAGQAPLTVLLQQGGQLKDMFGGAGEAASAMSGYVLGLLNPYTLAAAAAGTLTLAYYQGSKEADAFAKAIIMTGNVTGTTVSQLQGMAEEVSSSIGTEGEAAAALAELAGTGRVAASNLEYFARIAIQMERTVGQSVSTTAKDLAELGKAPLEASEKLDEKYHYLTASVYAQISALEEQGRVEEAGSIAQQAYAAAFDKRTQEITSNLGDIERAYQSSIGTIKGWWDAVLDVGRPKTLNDIAADIEAAKAKLERAQKFVRPFDRQSQIAVDFAQKELDVLLQKQAAVESQQRLDAETAKTGAEQLKVEQALTQWRKEGIKYLTEGAREEREVTLAREQGAAAGRSVEEIEARIGEIRKKYAGGKLEAEINKEATAYTNLLASIKAKTEENRLALASDESMTESQKIRIKLDQDLATGKIRLTAAHQGELSKLLDALGVSEQVIAQNKAMFKSAEEFANLYDRLSGDRDKLYEQVAAQQEYNDKLGLTVEQVAALDAAKLEEQATSKDSIATLMDEIDWSGKLGDTYRQQAEALRTLADEKRTGAARQTFVEAQKKAAEESKKVWENFTQNVQRNLGDGLYNAMQGNFDNIGDAFLSMLQRMMADAMAADIMNAIIPGSGGKGGSAAMFGAIAKGILGMFGGYTGSMAGYGGEYGNLAFDVGNVSAKGNLFSNGHLVPFAKGGAFTNGIVKSPTLFDTGLMGEAGPEAIMPLSRGPDGSLGVKASGGGGGNQIAVTYAPVIHIDSRTDRAEVQSLVSKAIQQGNAKLVDDLQRAGAIG